jgi:Tfp pilus assembly protein FimV
MKTLKDWWPGVLYLVAGICLAWSVVLSAQEPTKKPPTIEDLQTQVTQLQQQVAQKDAQIAQMQANIVASQKMFGACFQSLADAEQRAAQKE